MSALDDAIREQRKRLNEMDREARARMRQAYEHAMVSIERELDDAVRMLETISRSSAWFDASGRFTPEGEALFREYRLRELMPKIEAEYARFSDEAARILQAEQARAVSGGAQTAQEMAVASGIGGRVAFGANVNRQAMERLVSSFAPGSPLRDVLDSYGDFGRKVIERELTDAIALGKSPREASRTIRRTINNKGVRARIDTLSRSEIMRSYRGSLGEAFEGMKRPGDRYRRVAAKSYRTCLACLSRDGEITEGIPGDFHPNDRCIFQLVPAGMEMPYERGEDWLRRQSPERVRGMFSTPDAYAAWERGDVPLQAFAGVHRNRVWGSSLYVKSWRQVKRKATA
jgi:hypothetical protein